MCKSVYFVSLFLFIFTYKFIYHADFCSDEFLYHDLVNILLKSICVTASVRYINCITSMQALSMLIA